jgi:hypothetical protein
MGMLEIHYMPILNYVNLFENIYIHEAYGKVFSGGGVRSRGVLGKASHSAYRVKQVG